MEVRKLILHCFTVGGIGSCHSLDVVVGLRGYGMCQSLFGEVVEFRQVPLSLHSIKSILTVDSMDRLSFFYDIYSSTKVFLNFLTCSLFLNAIV
jgi:hypothetical protein